MHIWIKEILKDVNILKAIYRFNVIPIKILIKMKKSILKKKKRKKGDSVTCTSFPLSSTIWKSNAHSLTGSILQFSTCYKEQTNRNLKVCFKYVEHLLDARHYATCICLEYIDEQDAHLSLRTLQFGNQSEKGRLPYVKLGDIFPFLKSLPQSPFSIY
jgi:hypothetical protein